MTDLERGPSSDGESAICATSLNKPSSQEGLNNSSSTLVERLRNNSHPFANNKLQEEAATLISELQAETERLSRELDTSNNNHRSMAKTLAEAGERALAAESALSRIQSETVEACAKIAEEYQRESVLSCVGSNIAAAIRSLKLPDYRGGE